MYMNQTIQRPAGINVFGSCLIRVEPDYASLRFAVQRVAEHPEAAFGAARNAARSVRERLAESGVSDAAVHSSQLSLEQAWEGNGEARRAVGYRAYVGFQVMLEPLDRLEATLIGIVDAGVNTISSVSFKTRRLRELRASARKGAVEAARAKAEVYASAAGARVGPVVHLEDLNPDEMSRRSHMPDVDLTEHEESASPGAEGPGSIVIAAAVMACFTLLH